MTQRRLLDKEKYPTWYEGRDLVFTGSKYVDTGVKLWDSNKDFTLLFSITSISDGGSTQTIISSLLELSPYPGFVFDMGNKTYLRYASSSEYYLNNSSIVGIKKVYALKRLGNTFKVFSDKYPNGLDVTSGTNITTHNNNVLLGCHQQTNSTKIRYWTGTIHHCAIYSEALSDEQIKELINKEMA